MKEKKIKILFMRIFIVSVFVVLFSFTLYARENFNEDDSTYLVMFYNVENLFDYTDDSLTADEDFTPAGDLHWTAKRYYKKLDNVYKVITNIGGWNPPDIIGLCEIENRKVLQDLIYETPLSKFELGIIHEDSPDRRGIDVALLYNKRTIIPVQIKSLRLKHPGFLTRDILYVKLLMGNDSCHIFVNHWPSRSSGQLETEAGRFAAAKLLRYHTDSLFNHNPSVRILIMGDFNDDPGDESLSSVLNAKMTIVKPFTERLYNMTVIPTSGMIRGTLKYQGKWNSFDQIIVSGNMIQEEGLTVSEEGYTILHNIFLLQKDETYTGFKPFRTYNGYRYIGGYSDHLPVFIRMNTK